MPPKNSHYLIKSSKYILICLDLAIMLPILKKLSSKECIEKLNKDKKIILTLNILILMKLLKDQKVFLVWENITYYNIVTLIKK
jgi:hypothetical protein